MSVLPAEIAVAVELLVVLAFAFALAEESLALDHGQDLQEWVRQVRFAFLAFKGVCVLLLLLLLVLLVPVLPFAILLAEVCKHLLDVVEIHAYRPSVLVLGVPPDEHLFHNVRLDLIERLQIVKPVHICFKFLWHQTLDAEDLGLLRELFFHTLVVCERVLPFLQSR